VKERMKKKGLLPLFGGGLEFTEESTRSETGSGTGTGIGDTN